jgi:hypothetical protein
MDISIKRIAIMLVVIGGAYTAGVYQQKEVEIVEKEKIVYQEKLVYKDRVIKVSEMEQTKTVTETFHPNGALASRITVIDLKKKTGSQKDTDVTKDTDIVVDKDKKTVETPIHNGLGVSILAGLDITNPAGGYTFGGHITKPLFLGLTFGVWGMTNKTFGLSAGLQF